jgi:diaminohydroxyphosphoribosylaminopyrimidine deaminase / 5-amino-6-(5-phosphoribosylamino)uracil reductase
MTAQRPDHESLMKLAIAEGDRARGSTGDNPWVGCLITDGDGTILARGHTQGPGEHHAEIEAILEAKAHGHDVKGTTMYSTLEPCSFHGRTPACSRVIVDHAVGLVVLGMRDPHPRVDGEGARILRDAGVDVIEGVCERLVRRQLGAWVLAHHRHEPERRARELLKALAPDAVAAALVDVYDIDLEDAVKLAAGRETGR